MRDAAAAKAAMQGMADSVKAETAAEVAGSAQAAQARSKDIAAIQQQTQALSQLANSAKNTNTQLLYGGRSTPEQHLSDLSQELNYTTLLNRQKWLGFSSVQQATSYRQQMLALALLENKAHFAGYQTADQYLGFLQRETATTAALSSVIRDRTAAIAAETSVLLAHSNALQGTHQSAGSLGEQISGAGQLTAAINAIPDIQVTAVQVTGVPAAIAEVASYRAMLLSVPNVARTDVLTSATRLGGVPLTAGRTTVPVLARPDVDYAAVNRMLSQAVSQAAAQRSIRTPLALAAGPAAGPAGMGGEVESLSASVRRLHDGLAVSEDTVRRFGDSALLAAVDVRALADATDRLSAVRSILLGGQLPGSQKRTTTGQVEQLMNLENYAGSGRISNVPGGYPRTAPVELEPVAREPLAVEAPRRQQDPLAGLLQKDDVEMEWVAGAADSTERLGESLADVSRQANQARGDWRVVFDEMAAAEEHQMVIEGEYNARREAALHHAQEVLQRQDGFENGLANAAGMGGSGGGGGAPPPGGAGTGSPDDDDEPDPGIWSRVQAGIEGSDQKLQDYVRDLDGARRALPGPDVAGVWDRLGESEETAGRRAADAVRQLQDMARAAAEAGKAAEAARYAWAANTLLAASMKSAGSDAEEEVSRLAELSAGADRVRDSAKYAYAAQQLLASGLGGIDDPAARAAARLTEDAEAAANADRSFSKWTALLKKEVPLWSGLLGDTHMIGMVQLWHIALDSVVEVLALWVPALVTAGVGLGGWAAAAVKSAQEVARQYVNLRTVGSALNETIAPLTDNFQKMENAVRPQVYELLGDYLTIAGGKAGPFNDLIMQTGNYLDRLAAKITVALQNGGGGLASFFAAGTRDLALIGQGFDSLGPIIEKFLKATAITHVAEDLAAVGDAILKVAASIVKIIPTPVLAVALGLHAIVLWGGLAADVVGKVVIKIAGLTSNFESLNGLSMSLARNLSASDEQMVKIGSRSAAVQAVFDALGGAASKEKIAQTGLAIEREAGSVENFVGSFAGSAARLEQFGGGLDTAGRKAVALGISAGATDTQLAGMASHLSGTARGAAELEEGAAGAAGEIGGGGGLLAMLGNLAPVLSNAYVDIGLVVAALTGLFVFLGTRADATRKFTDALGSVVARSSDLTVVSATVTSLAKATQALNEAQKTGVGNTAELSASQQDLSGKLGNELSHVGDVSRAYGTDFVGSLNLLKAAGVNVSQLFTGQNSIWSAAMQQVKGLVDGYRAMGQQLGMVGGDLNAMQLSESSQLTSMQTLNQAWDAFTKLVAGAPAAFISYAQGVATFETDAKKVGAAMTGLNAPSLALQGAFQSNYSDVESLFDAFRTDQAAGSGGNFSQFVKNAVQTLIPMAGGSKEAAAQISALAQEAGGPATTNIQELARWAGKTHDPLRQLYDDSNKAAEGTANLSQDAGRLTSTMQQLLDPAMASAIFNAHGGQQVFEEFSKSLLKSGPSSKVTVDAAHSVAQELLAVTGNSREAKAQFIGYAEASGLNAKQAEKLWDEASQNIGKNVGKIRDDLAAQSQVTMKIKPPSEKDDIMSSFKNGTFYEVGELSWIPGVQNALTKVNHAVGQFFVTDIPKAFDVTRHAFAAAWAGMTDWFAQSVPHALEAAWDPVPAFFDRSFTHDIPAAWDRAWGDLVSPVARGFDAVKNFVASSFDTWWKTHGEAVEAIWNAVWGTIRSDAILAWEAIESDAKTAWHVITGIFDSGAVKAIWHFFGNEAKAAWDMAVGGARSAWTEIEGLAKAAWDLVAATGRAAWDLLWAFAGADAKSAADVIVAAFKIVWATVTAAAKLAWDTIVLIVDLVIDIVTGHWHTAWEDILAYGKQVFNVLKTWAVQVWNAISTAAGQVFNAMWNALKTGGTQAWNALRTGATQAWSAVWHAFSTTVVQPMTRFFTSTIPGWYNTIAGKWNLMWSSGWNAFNKDILQPVERWFTSTLPSAMENSLKSGINHVIKDINTVIGFINAVTSVVDVHIKTITPLASGGETPTRLASGSVPGTGDEDGTHIVAMGGEYMLRKPARMALQAAYGPDFLDTLNNADTILGSGSRGNAASQRHSSGGRYAAGGGIGNWLGDIGSAVSGAAGDAWSGITGAAKDVARFGEKAVFDAMWSASGEPLEKAMEKLGTPGGLGAAWVQDVHNGVETWISGQTSKASAAAAKSGGGISMAGVSNSSAVAALQSAAAKKGWYPGAQWAFLNDVEMREAGYNIHAQNPTSDAYGMAQFINGPGEYAQYGGNSTTAAGQSVAMVNYIAQRYRTPQAAWAMEESAGYYAAGGRVTDAIKTMGGSADTKKALALGSYLLTHWNDAATDPSRHEYGPWLLNLAEHKSISKATAENPVKALSAVAAAYGTGTMESTSSAWSKNPAAAALKAYGYASEKLGTHWSTPSAATLAQAWDQVTSALGGARSTTTAGTSPASVAEYQKQAALLYPEWEGALGPWHSLYAVKEPATGKPATRTLSKSSTGKSKTAVSPEDAAWAAWLKQRGVIQDRVATASGYVAPLFANLKKNPVELTAAEWSNTDSSVRRFEQAVAAATWAEKNEPKYTGPIKSNLTRMLATIPEAYAGWHEVYGTVHTPGPGGGGPVTTPGAGSGPGGVTGPTVIDLSDLIIGSPSAGSGGGNMGFNLAGGGPVGLSDVAGMFSGGMAAGGRVPALNVPGLNAGMAKQLSSAASGSLPRTLSEAAGNRVGLQVDQLTINNPVGQTTEESIARTSNRLAALGGRGGL
jgi:hypothetical protein